MPETAVKDPDFDTIWENVCAEVDVYSAQNDMFLKEMDQGASNAENAWRTFVDNIRQEENNGISVY